MMRPGALYSLGLLMIALYGGWQWHRPIEGAASSPLLPPALPVLKEAPSKQWLPRILQHDLWSPTRGKQAKQTSKTAPKTKQHAKKPSVIKPRLLAVSRDIDTTISLALFRLAKDKPPQAFYEGDLLPNGAQLDRILSDGVVLDVNGVKQHVYLFGKK